MRAASNAADIRAAGAPSKRRPRTAGSQRRRTKYSWKGRSPSGVSTTVRIGSSDMGAIRDRTPRRAARSAVTALKDSPARSRRVRSTWVARSRSPSRNQSSPPSAPSASRKFHDSPASPHPVSGLARPERVYITVSRSGQMLRPRCSKSSPVLTTMRRSCGESSAAWRPAASFAPPTPPASARITGRGPARGGGRVAGPGLPAPPRSGPRRRARERGRPASPPRPRP